MSSSAAGSSEEEFHALVVRAEPDSSRRAQLRNYIDGRGDHRGRLERWTGPSDIQAYLEHGLGRARASELFLTLGENRVLSPQKCPPVLCCLLPCLNSTPTMKAYNNNRPETATVCRSGRKFLIDSTNLVEGDVVTVYEGDIVPADLRCVRVTKGPLQVDVAVLFSTPAKRKKPMIRDISEEEDAPGVSLLDSKRMLFMGATVTSGTAVCIVTKTGSGTLWSSMIAMDRWPF